MEKFVQQCIDNKYSKWYFSIIENSMKRNWSKKEAPVYVEGHHYIPKSLGGTDDNLVYLTAKEHFICHVLLTKMLTGQNKAKMVWAVMCMKGKENRYVNGFLYESLKRNLSHSQESRDKMSKTRKGIYSGEKNPMFGKRGTLSPISGVKQTEEHKRKRINKLIGRKQSAESRLLMSANRPKGPSGKKWFNNGCIESFDLPENKPSDFVFGRLKRKA